jgi:hypothetical protein
VNKPEAALLGVQYVGDPVKAGSILIANASHWLMNGTGLKNGDCLPGMLAYEADAFVPGVTPADTDILATSPVGPFPNDHDYPPGVSGTPNSSCVSHVTWYSNGKASVFATGSMGWSWGLDDYNAPELRPAFSNVAAQQITENLLDSFIHPITITVPRILPAALRGNLYQLALSAVGGTPPYVWTVSGLPPDLNLNNSGLLDGISNGQATVHFTVTATDANQQTASAALTLPIQEAPQNPKVLSITFIGQGTAMAPTESAGVVPKTNWNNALGNTRTVPLPLADESGLMTGASVTWTSDNPWSMPIADSPGDCRMMKGYLDNGEGNVTTVNVSGLLPSPKGYDIYVYVDADNESENKTGTYSIGGPGITSLSVTATDLANTDFTGAFQQAQNSPGNYVKFSGVNATTFTLIASPQSGHRAPVNAMQIVPV